MSLVSRMRGFFERRTTTVSDAGSPMSPNDWLIRAFGGAPAAAGVPVNESTALSWTALMAGVRFLSETLAALPLDVFQRRDTRGRDALPLHPLARMYRSGPNPEQTWFEWIELGQAHAVLWGNAYSQIIFNQGGEPAELWPLNPDRVTMERRRDGILQYRVTFPADDLGGVGGSAIIPFDEMLHVRGFSRWGLLGERIARVHREAIGLGLATEVFGSLLFGQGLNAGGFLEHPQTMSKEAQDRLRTAIEAQAAGLSNAHRLAVLEEGMKFNPTTIEPEKAQFLGLRQFQVQEASRILRIPPHLLYDLSRATFSNIEHQAIEVVTYTILPWCRRWESRMDKQLISTKMKNLQFTKFNLNGLLRGDTAAQTAAFQAGRQGGWFSVNDIRELLDLNPVPKGDGYLEPENMRPLGAPPKPVTPPAPPVDAEGVLTP